MSADGASVAVFSPVAGAQPSLAPGACALLPAAPMLPLLPNKPPSKLYVLTERLRLLDCATEAAVCLPVNLHA
jgi:hypothetical protein